MSNPAPRVVSSAERVNATCRAPDCLGVDFESHQVLYWDNGADGLTVLLQRQDKNGNNLGDPEQLSIDRLERPLTGDGFSYTFRLPQDFSGSNPYALTASDSEGFSLYTEFEAKR